MKEARATCPGGRLLKDPKRQTRVIDLDKRVKEAFGKGDGKGKKGPTDPDGFLEGALLNRDVAAAHDKYMSDVEVKLAPD